MSRTSLLLFFFPLLVACSNSSDAPGDAGTSGDTLVGCAADEGDTYIANLEKPGASSKYTFTLVQASPAPPTLQQNTWTLKVVDGTGTPPAASQLMACTFMPKMGHPSDQTPQFMSNADGTFTVSDIDLFMPGLWTVAVGVDPQGAAPQCSRTGLPVGSTDYGVYTFCIGG